MLTRVYSAVAFCGPNKKSFSFPFYVKGTSFIFVIPHLNGLHLKSESTVHVQFFFFWHNLTALFLFFFSSPFFFVGYSLPPPPPPLINVNHRSNMHLMKKDNRTFKKEKEKSSLRPACHLKVAYKLNREQSSCMRSLTTRNRTSHSICKVALLRAHTNTFTS